MRGNEKGTDEMNKGKGTRGRRNWNQREKVYLKINIYVYIENIISLFCNMKIFMWTIRQTAVPSYMHMYMCVYVHTYITLVAVPPWVCMYVCVCVYVHTYIMLVAYQKNLLESHDLGLEKKKKKIQLRSNFNSYSVQTWYKSFKWFFHALFQISQTYPKKP